MRADVSHRFVAEILNERATPLATVPLDPIDWIPAMESAHFQQLRKAAAPMPLTPSAATITPGWDGVAGAPYVSHIEVTFDSTGAPADPVPLQYFAHPVQHAVSALVEAGTIEQGQQYRWRICAYRATHPARGPSGDDLFRVEETRESGTALAARSLADLLARAEPGVPAIEAGAQRDFPVFIAAHVLREAIATAIAGGEREAGGLLLGRLARDTGGGDLLVEVTAQVPAREAIPDDVSLRFTPETWQAVTAAIQLRRESEQVVGWYHSHPAALWPCKNCPPARRAACPSNQSFFSAMDVGFHRTAFQAAHNVAMLLSFHADPQPQIDLFGWRRGVVARRGYYSIEVRT